MRLRSVQNKGLKRFIEDDDSRGFRPDFVKRVRAILTVLMSAQDMDGVQGPPGLARSSTHWRPRGRVEHFRVGPLADHIHQEGEICNLDLEDYH
jgi:proteic killer suppression protein